MQVSIEGGTIEIPFDVMAWLNGGGNCVHRRAFENWRRDCPEDYDRWYEDQNKKGMFRSEP